MLVEQLAKQRHAVVRGRAQILRGRRALELGDQLCRSPARGAAPGGFAGKRGSRGLRKMFRAETVVDYYDREDT